MKQNARRKWQLSICCFLIFIFILSGCDKGNPKGSQSADNGTIEVTQDNPWEGTDGRQLVPKLDETKYSPLKFSVDFYALPQFYQDFFSPSQISSYYHVVDAYLNFETSVTYEQESDLENIWGLLKECFPLFYADVIDESIDVNTSKKEIRWNYTTTSKEEHDALIDDFANKITQYMEGVSERDTDTEKAFIIYLNFIRNIKYDTETYESKDYNSNKTGGYSALVNGSGVCMSFSKGYAYLLNQVGIDAIDIAGEGASAEIEGHAWTMMKLNGIWYFSDPTWDVEAINGIRYFAFTAAQREQEDNYPFEYTTFCSNGDLRVPDYFEVNDTRFDEIREWIWVKDLNRETDELVYVLYPDSNETEYQFSLK